MVQIVSSDARWAFVAALRAPFATTHEYIRVFCSARTSPSSNVTVADSSIAQTQPGQTYSLSVTVSSAVNDDLTMSLASRVWLQRPPQ